MLVDSFQRPITYLRLSVTDRCDFRCTYCMAEQMQFLPRAEVLSLEELAEVAEAFAELGVKRIRVTGGEPLVRRGITGLLARLGRIPGLDTLALTTNGSHLAGQARAIRAAGVSRLNISLDSLQPARFRALTRSGDLAAVLAGIDAARAAGIPQIRINSVILKGINDDEITGLAGFALQRGLDIAFIEEMPLGELARDRQAAFMPSAAIRERLAAHYALHPCAAAEGGPARYYQAAGHPGRIGFISPHSHNFCERCNRVRLTAEGRLLLCLGHEHSVDLKAVLRRQPGDREALKQAIVAALPLKPERHHFRHGEPVQVLRFMNATGG